MKEDVKNIGAKSSGMKRNTKSPKTTKKKMPIFILWGLFQKLH